MNKEIEKSASDIVNECIEKIAETENKENNTKKRIGLGVGGATAIGSSKNMILGKKRMYHGTSKENWDKIKHEGLRADKGGRGGASVTAGSNQYIKNSKGKVHVTKVKPLANLYSNMNKKDSPYTYEFGRLQQKMQSYMKEENGGFTIDNSNPHYKDYVKAKEEFEDFHKKNGNKVNGEFAAGMKSQGKNGKRIKINMDYDKFKSMEVDPDQAGKPFKNKLVHKIQKNVASRGNINITPEEIVGSSAKLKDRVKHTAKAMPKYIKNNPLRFGTGVALVGGGAYALGKALKKQEKTASAAEELGLKRDIKRKLSKEEKKELNRNVRSAQNSLLKRRQAPSSRLKNELATIGGAAIGAGLGFGAYKGMVNASGLKSSIKAANLSRQLDKRKVFDSVQQFKNMNKAADAYKQGAKLKKTYG